MRPGFFVPRSGLVLSTFASISLYGNIAYAQSDNNSDSNSDSETATNNDSATESSNKSTAADDSATSTKEEAASSTEAADSTTEEAASSTEAAETTSTDNESTLATMISSSSADSESTLTGMPTITGVYAIPSYPAATVPPTNDAPFMQHSSAPDGTVFIAVGAILGAIGIAILLWRVIVGFLLHRSVERAAKAQHDANAKTGFLAPPAPFYKYTDNASNMSLNAGRGVRRTNRGPILSSTPSASNLFFSPTAAASNNAAGGNRASAFLPSGFYAAGNSSPGGNHDHSISLTNLRPDSHGQYGNPSRHTLNATPPDSPSFHARRDISNTSLNLTRPPSQRAPSAFLDDLLADDPSALPPPHMPGSGGQRNSSYGNGSQNRF